MHQFPNTLDSSAEETHVSGSHLYIRILTVKWETVVATLENKGDHIRYLHIYCDQLTCKNETSLLLQLPSNLRTVWIFARDFFSSVSQLTELNWKLPPVGTNQKIYIYCEDAPKSLVIRSASSQLAFSLFHHAASCPDQRVGADGMAIAPTHRHLEKEDVPMGDGKDLEGLFSGGISQRDIEKLMKVAQDATAGTGAGPRVADLGRYLQLTNQKSQDLIVETLKSVPELELSGPPLGDVASYGSDILRTNNLPKLLHQIFSVVGAKVLDDIDPTRSILSQLRFIIKCASQSPSVGSLANDAQAVLARVELPARYPGMPGDTFTRYLVPPTRPESLLDDIKNRIESSRVVDGKITEAAKTIGNESSLRELVSSVFEALKDDVENGFIDLTAKDKVISAIDDRERQREHMEVSVRETRRAADAFQRGIADYQAEKKKEYILSLVKVGVELVVSIGVSVYTCGAGGPITLQKLYEAQGVVGKVVTTGEKVWTAIKGILEACAKLGPKLFDAFNSQSALNQTILAITKSDRDAQRTAAGIVLDSTSERITPSRIPEDAAATVDYYGILSDWEEFDQRVDAMFDGLREDLGDDKIQGMTEYRLAFKSQAVRGKAVIMAMQDVQDVLQRYYQQQGEVKARQVRKLAFEEMAKNTQQQSDQMVAQSALRWNLLQESRNMRRGLFVSLHEYLLAVLYATNDPGQVKLFLQGIGIESPTEAFNSRLAYIRKESTSSKTPDVLMAKIKISTANSVGAVGAVFAEDWKERLMAEGVLYFDTRNGKLQSVKRYHDIRIDGITANFLGLKVPDGKVTEWTWKLGPEFTNIGKYGEAISYYMPIQTLPQTGGIGAWSDQKHELSAPSLFCKGVLVFDKSISSSEVANSLNSNLGEELDVDFSDVSGVELIFECRGKARA